MAINKVILTDNLTRDAELKALPSGTSLAAFGIAVNDRKLNSQTNEWENYPNFFNCNLFGTRAEKIAKYLTKGKKIAVEGKLHYSAWQDANTGAKRSKIDITVQEIEFLSAANNAPAVNNAPANSAPAASNAQSAYSDEDIPF